MARTDLFPVAYRDVVQTSSGVVQKCVIMGHFDQDAHQPRESELEGRDPAVGAAVSGAGGFAELCQAL